MGAVCTSLVTAKGAKLWRYKFRLNGTERLMSLGSYPAMGLQTARELHIAASGQVQLGQNPGRPWRGVVGKLVLVNLGNATAVAGSGTTHHPHFSRNFRTRAPAAY